MTPPKHSARRILVRFLIGAAATLAATVTLVMLVGRGQAAPPAQSGPPVVTPGGLVGNVNRGAVRFRNFNSGSGNEVFLSAAAQLGSGPRSEIGLTWRQPSSSPPTNTVTFGYIPATTLLTTTVNGASSTTFNPGNITPLNTLQIVVYARQAGTTVAFRNVRLNGDLLPTNVFTAAPGAATGVRTWTITGVNLSGGFRLTGDLRWTGTQPGGENNKLEIFTGYRDFDGPLALDVATAPAPGLVVQPITVTARISDVLTGNSPITAAQFSRDGGPWIQMQAVDGAFNSPVESVRGLFTPRTLDPGTVCVRGIDSLNNVGQPVCTPYTVTYQPGAITLTKETDVAVAATFPFTWSVEFTEPSQAGITPGGRFDLDGSGPGASAVIAAVPGVRHVITEQTPEGWVFTGASCTDAGGAPVLLETGPGARIAFTYTTPGGYRCLWQNAGPAITVVKTVGTESGSCATTDTIAVQEGTELFYCYTVENSGATTLTTHTVEDDVLGSILTDFPYTLAPGASAFITSSYIPLTTTTNIVTWTASGGAVRVQAQDAATVTVTPLTTAIAVTKSVGTDSGTCAATQSISVLKGTEVFFCYTVVNTGERTLTTHTVEDSVLGNILTDFPYSLAPGASAFITTASVPITTTTNIVTWTASAGAISAQARDTASVIVEPVTASISLVKGVGTDPLACATASALAVAPGTPVYYCAKVTNTGTITLTRHTLIDDQLGALLTDADFTLPPGASVTTLDLGVTIDATPLATVTNTMTWTASLPERATASADASATVTIVPPAITLRKTVGTTPAACAASDTLEVTGPTVVYYCYTVTNSGALTLTRHTLIDSDLGTLLADFAYPLAPGASVSTVDAGRTISRALQITTTNVATWSARLPAIAGASATARATVSVLPVGPLPLALSLRQTAGLDPEACGLADDLFVEQGTPVYFCYTATNTGEAPLRVHRLVDEAAGLLLDDLDLLLNPGQSISSVDAGAVISAVVASDILRRGVWTAFDAQGRSVTASAEAGVRTGVAALEVTKVVAAVDSCSGAPVLNLEAGAPVYYCFRLTNTGDFTFTEHLIRDARLGLSETIAQNLPPGASLTLSNDQLSALGPVRITQTVTNTVQVTSSGPGEAMEAGEQIGITAVAPVTVTAEAAALVRIATPTDDEPDAEPDEAQRLYLPWIGR